MRRLLFLLALCSVQCAHAQWFNNITAFTTEHGLSNNSINCLQKDLDGFLWIGTHEGLNRYDGTEFINVLSNSKNNLPSNSINKICLINKHLMAVGTDAGLCLLNPQTLTGTAIQLPYNPDFSNTGFGIADIFFKAAANEIWVATWHGLFVMDIHGKILRQIMAPATDMSKGFFARHFIKDGNGKLYIYCQQKKMFAAPDFSTQQLLPAETTFTGFDLNGLLNTDHALMGLQMLGDEIVCVFSKRTATGYEEFLSYNNTASKRHFIDKLDLSAFNEKRLSNAFILNDSTFIINSYFGEPILYHSNSHTTTVAADHALWFTSWPDGIGATVYIDQNNTWIGTSKGLLRSSAMTNFFKTNHTLVDKIKNKKALVSFNYGLYNNHKLWLACMGAGLYGLDTITNVIHDVFQSNSNPAFTKNIICTEVMPVNRSLWLFSVYGPLQVDPLSNTISAIQGKEKDAAFDNAAAYPLKDASGKIWATLPTGIAVYDPGIETFTSFKPLSAGGTLPVLRANHKTMDLKGNVWMVRQDTLVKLDARSKAFSLTLIKHNNKALRPITSLCSDGDDVLYLSVAGSFGIYHISTGSVELFTKQTGIVSTAISDIVSDVQGNAWVATEGGLLFYSKSKKKFSSFTKADGLPDDNIIGINFTDASKTTLFLGFAKTYCLFDPQNFFLEKSVPQNRLTGVEVDGEFLPVDSTRVLSYQQNNISFTYTGINFNQGQQNNYACMLVGFDRDWKYTGGERQINYINLPPGKYVFKVKSANHQGEWNEMPASFTFEITPPFWQRWWFRALMIGLLITGIYYFIKLRDAAVRKENNLKLQMSELRMQALRAQMNPHFIFNSLNSIQSYILSNNTIDAAGYLSKFAKLMRRILDQSKHNFLPLEEVMATLKLYVEIEAFRFNNEFSYSFDIEDNDDLLDAKIPPMLLQPFIENAILHGLMPKQGDKKLVISCQLVDRHVEIIIDDNGIGRTQLNAKAGHDSQGQKLTAGMLESLQQMQNSKASIDIIDKTDHDVPSGTTVKIILPLN